MDWHGFDREAALGNDSTQNRRTLIRQGKRWDAEEAVRVLLREDAPWLLAGSVPPEDAKTVVKNLLRKIDRFKNAESRRLSRNFLIRGIDTGCKEKRWDLPVPAQTLRTPLPKPPITETTFPDIARIDRLRQAFIDALHDPAFPDLGKIARLRWMAHATAPLSPNDLAAGSALFAAVLFGGLAQRERLESLAVCGQGALHSLDGKLWIEWVKVAEHDAEIERWTRWYPDAISGFLIARAHRMGQFPLIRLTSNTCGEEIWKRMRGTLELLALADEDRPRSLKQLLDWTKSWLYYRISPCLAGYAVGHVDSVSMTPDAHYRMLLCAPAPVHFHREHAASHDTVRDPTTLPGRISTAPANVLQLREELRGTLKGATEKHRAIVKIDQFLRRDDLSPAFVRLAQWARTLCDHHQGDGTSRRLSSIHSYLTRIDTALATVLEARDPATLDEEDLGELYSEILDGMKPGKAARAAGPLLLFHRYLVAAHGAPQDVGSVFDDRGVAGAVDANMASESEYTRSLPLLESEVSGQPVWLAHMQQAALMLGYRGKLRRGEVRRLRVGDVCGAVFGVIYVRTTDKGQVKSTAGIRNLSIAGHFPEDEMKQLRKFVISRLRQITASDDLSQILSPYDDDSRSIRERPLFENPEQRGQLVSEKALFDPIKTVLCEVSGDPGMHYHLLRKGGSNLHFPVLMEEELPGCSHFYDPSGEIAKASPQLNEALVGTAGPDRRKLWALSASAGHASPATTTGSYLLCFDWLLSYALQEVSPQLTSKLLSALTGLTENNIRVQCTKKKVVRSDIVFWVAHNHAEWLDQVTVKHSTPEPVKKADTERPKPRPATPPPLPGHDTLVLLNAVIMADKNADLLARRSSLLPEVVMPWIDKAQALCKLLGKSPALNSIFLPVDGAPKSVAGYGLVFERQMRLPPTLRQMIERNRLNRWTSAIHAAAVQRPDEIAAWLNVVWQNRRARNHEIQFRNIENARDFLALLRKINPGDTANVSFRLHPLVRAKAPTPEQQADIWADALGIDVLSIRIGDSLARQAAGDGIGSIGISLGHDHRLSAETKRFHKKKGKPEIPWCKEESTAFEAACYVVSIWMLSGLYSHPERKLQPGTGDGPPPQIHEPNTPRRKPKVTGIDLRPELIILCGIPASGKTTLYKSTYASTHRHISLDTTTSGSRAREWKAFSVALARGESIVIDNTNLTPKHRERYLLPARDAGYRVVGVQLKVTLDEALKRNVLREKPVPEIAIRMREKEFVALSIEEGFDELRAL